MDNKGEELECTKTTLDSLLPLLALFQTTLQSSQINLEILLLSEKESWNVELEGRI